MFYKMMNLLLFMSIPIFSQNSIPYLSHLNNWDTTLTLDKNITLKLIIKKFNPKEHKILYERNNIVIFSIDEELSEYSASPYFYLKSAELNAYGVKYKIDTKGIYNPNTDVKAYDIVEQGTSQNPDPKERSYYLKCQIGTDGEPCVIVWNVYGGVSRKIIDLSLNAYDSVLHLDDFFGFKKGF